LPSSVRGSPLSGGGFFYVNLASGEKVLKKVFPNKKEKEIEKEVEKEIEKEKEKEI